VDPATVRAHLERILLSGPFRNSERYPALLRYVVEQELNGASSELKERTIAIEVFGRDPSYDPGADPVVRISAGEVRKQLAQYYQEVTDPGQLRTFQRTGRLQWIADRDRPSFQDWKNDLGQADEQGNLALKRDYAIISRVANPRTGFITVTVAGLWGYGTLAAGRFLTDPKYIQDFANQTGFNFEKGNIQLVIGTEVIQGKPGPPTVLAATSW
jgi:hypothetical protein